MPDPHQPLLLAGATLVTLDAEAGILHQDLLLEDGRIAAFGPAAVPVGTRRLDVAGCLVLPGLIQGHVHLGQTLFRGLAEGRRLMRWLGERIWPLEAAHDDDSAYWSGLLGAAECLLSGTTTIQEIGLGPGAPGLVRAIETAGLRGFAGPCLMDEADGLPAGLATDTDAALAGADELGARLGAAGGRLRPALNPRFLLSCSPALWRGTVELASARGWPVHTHALEQADEGELVRARFGRDEIGVFEDLGLLDLDLRIAHGVQLTADHRRRVSGRRFSVCTCPGSNLKLGSGIADLVGLREARIPVSVGADGPPCNNDLDVLEEVRLAALLQTLRHGPAAFSGRDALRLATSEGARALGLDDLVGSIELGKRADLVVLGSDRPELFPLTEDADPGGLRADLHDLVVYGASRASVRHVIVDGEPLVADGRLLHLDLQEIRREAKRALRELLRRARIPAGA
ncbi:MAG TPA: amidohydrolase family protein [Thermoanaerobaculia bacterium]|nr:amidohydrolase family protein [Thermoanaerobaculia bacterium]